jgi:hypothetical protein
MSDLHPIPTQDAADRLSARLRALYDALPPDEQAVMAALLHQAVAGGPEVSGYTFNGLQLAMSLKRAPLPVITLFPDLAPVIAAHPEAAPVVAAHPDAFTVIYKDPER